MRIFQNSGINKPYAKRLAGLCTNDMTFLDRIQTFHNDRYGAVHHLLPVYSLESGFFANGDDEPTQRLWAKEKGLPSKTPLDKILLCQIEEHKTDVFYNLDPVRYDGKFVRRLPGSVKHRIAWRAVHNKGSDLKPYDLMVCNFPEILRSFENAGCKTKYFFPSYDPVMDSYAKNAERDIGVLFVGSYSRFHKVRAKILEAVADLNGQISVKYHLNVSKYTKLAESPFNILGFGSHSIRPKSIIDCSHTSLYGRDLYDALSRAKIVLNGAIDMSGVDKGNMRCFEAFGCGAALVTDVGRYPEGFLDGENYFSYSEDTDIKQLILDLTIGSRMHERHSTALTGHEMIRTTYSKEKQWKAFEGLL